MQISNNFVHIPATATFPTSPTSPVESGAPHQPNDVIVKAEGQLDGREESTLGDARSQSSRAFLWESSEGGPALGIKTRHPPGLKVREQLGAH